MEGRKGGRKRDIFPLKRVAAGGGRRSKKLNKNGWLADSEL